MNKTEEIILLGVAALFLFKMMKGTTSATTMAAINAQQNVGYANAAAGVLTAGFDDFS